MTYRSIDDILNTNNQRRQSQRPEDQAYMAHWNAAKRSTCQGPRPCSVFGLCAEGERLDALCREAEAQDEELFRIDTTPDHSDSSEHLWWYPDAEGKHA